jgi:hypothetical protein
MAGMDGYEKSRPTRDSNVPPTESFVNCLNFGYFRLLKCDAVLFGIYIYQYIGIDSCFHPEGCPIIMLNCVFSLQADVLNITKKTTETPPKILFVFGATSHGGPVSPHSRDL